MSTAVITGSILGILSGIILMFAIITLTVIIINRKGIVLMNGEAYACRN